MYSCRIHSIPFRLSRQILLHQICPNIQASLPEPDCSGTRLCTFRIAVLSFCAVISLTAGALTWQALLSRFGSGSVTAAIAGVAAACLGLAATWPLARLAVYLQRQRLSGTVDATFDAEYRSSLAVGTSDNLHQAWHAIREETAQVIREAPLRLPFFGEFRRRQLDSAAAKVFASFQKGV